MEPRFDQPAKKLTREQKLVESIHNKRRKYGLNTDRLTESEKEIVMKHWKEDHPGNGN